MDVLYVGDIPNEYHFAIFNNGYIDLYNTDTLHNNSYTFYRVYTNCGGFFYDVKTTSVGAYTTTYTRDVQVSSNPMYRFDFPNILFMTVLFSLIGIWFLNLFTSIIRKGGVLGGLF